MLEPESRPPLGRGFILPRVPFDPAAFAMAWDSSNTITPSKRGGPPPRDSGQQATTWSSREALPSRAGARSVV